MKELETNNKCFVISPIGTEGSENYDRFKEVLDYIIKPAFKNFGHDLEVIRADEINKTGSLIKDILKNIYNSFIVIADLTGQNANVFYELGVRHSLKPRTILIAQSTDDIPFDIQEYRTIIYETSAKGAAMFGDKLKGYLDEIFENPVYPDNPVLDRLGNIIDRRIIELEKENKELRESQLQNNELSERIKSLSKPKKEDLTKEEHVKTRLNRIYELMNLKHDTNILLDKNYIEWILPPRQGNFEVYSINDNIKEIYYISDALNLSNFQTELADIRVLIEKCSKGEKRKIILIMATNSDLSGKKEEIRKKFNKMKDFVDEKSRNWFSLEIWDKSVLLEKEKELGIKV